MSSLQTEFPDGNLRKAAGGSGALPPSVLASWVLNASVYRAAHWGSLPSPGGPLLPGSPRGTAWSEDTEGNRVPQEHCQPPRAPKLPASSHLSRQLHPEKVLITPCSKSRVHWQGIKRLTLLCKRGGNLSDLYCAFNSLT